MNKFFWEDWITNPWSRSEVGIHFFKWTSFCEVAYSLVPWLSRRPHRWNQYRVGGKVTQISQVTIQITSFSQKEFTPLLSCSEKAMAPHSSTLAWKIPWMEEPDWLRSMGSLRVGHDWVTSLSLFTFVHWRRKWQPTPVFLPGESQGRRSLVGCRLWGLTELDTTEATWQQQQQQQQTFSP